MTEEITKEPKLLWSGKEREADILADTMSLPFQEVKRFGQAREGEWVNKLIFGDNLQALKYLLKLKKEGKLRNPDGSDGVKLIYIDPPFGTGDIYGDKGTPAYSAALQGAEFIDFLRKRLIILRELLTQDGTIYLRLDYHFGHYMKVVIDELFDRNNFMNEIIVNRIKKNVMISQKQKSFPVAVDSLYVYTKNRAPYLKEIFKKRGEIREGFWRHMDDSAGQGPSRTFFGIELHPPKGKHWKYSQENIDKMIQEKKLRFECRNCRQSHTEGYWKKCSKCGENDPRPKYWVEPTDVIVLDTNWTDIPGYSPRWNYPTENSEELLDRVIRASSNPDDIVLDCFAGSGTTGAIAEKLKRKWIMCDIGKLSIYTIQKRLLNLHEEIGEKGKSLKHKPFVVYNVGLYDYNLIEKLGEEEYKNFVLDLFQADKLQTEDQNYNINGLKFDGKLFGKPVKVFDRKGFLTEDYVKDLHKTVGESITDTIFIICPATNVEFIRTSLDFDGKRYYILKVPYSIIDELHSKPFKRLIQPNSASKINEIVDSVGFDFIYPPEVKREFYSEKRGGLFPNEKDYIIHITKVNPIQITNNPVELEDGLEALAGVFIDYNYDNKTFNLGKAFFADEVLEKGDAFKVKIESEKCGNHICIIYLDVLGNEKIEVIKKSEFGNKR